MLELLYNLVHPLPLASHPNLPPMGVLAVPPGFLSLYSPPTVGFLLPSGQWVTQLQDLILTVSLRILSGLRLGFPGANPKIRICVNVIYEEVFPGRFVGEWESKARKRKSCKCEVLGKVPRRRTLIHSHREDQAAVSTYLRAVVTRKQESWRICSSVTRSRWWRPLSLLGNLFPGNSSSLYAQVRVLASWGPSSDKQM